MNFKILTFFIALASCNTATFAMQLPPPTTVENSNQSVVGISVVLSADGTLFTDKNGNLISLNGRKIIRGVDGDFFFVPKEGFFLFPGEAELTITEALKLAQQDRTQGPSTQHQFQQLKIPPENSNSSTQQPTTVTPPTQPTPFNPHDKNVRCRVVLREGIFYNESNPTEKVQLLGRNIMQFNRDKTKFWFEPSNHQTPVKDSTDVTANYPHLSAPNKPAQQSSVSPTKVTPPIQPIIQPKSTVHKIPTITDKTLNVANRFKEAGIATVGLSGLLALTYSKFTKSIKDKKLTYPEFVKAYARFALKQIDKDPKCAFIALATILAEGYCIYKRIKS